MADNYRVTDKETREKLHQLLDMVIDRTELGNDTFFDYSPHCNMVSIQLHNGRWSKEKGREYKGVYAYLKDGGEDEYHPLSNILVTMGQEVNRIEYSHQC